MEYYTALRWRAFYAFEGIRNKSIHFNPNTYSSVREDALSAIKLLREIIDGQFGTFGIKPWLISGTRGHQFIKKEFENHPFIETYFKPTCPFVGPLFSMDFDEMQRAKFFDFDDYGLAPWSDEEFSERFNSRAPESLCEREAVNEIA
ncbi:MAG: hypothetical protein WDZ84_07955 [Rhodovibrionaceae bacterium]